MLLSVGAVKRVGRWGKRKKKSGRRVSCLNTFPDGSTRVDSERKMKPVLLAPSIRFGDLEMHRPQCQEGRNKE